MPDGRIKSDSKYNNSQETATDWWDIEEYDV